MSPSGSNELLAEEYTEQSQKPKNKLIIKKKIVRNEQMIENHRIQSKLEKVKATTGSLDMPFRYK